MAASAPSIVTRVAYGVSQLPRVAWYLGHGLALRRLAEAARRRDGAKAQPRVHTKAPVPDRSRLYADMAKLFLRDLANGESGIYPLPADHAGSLLTLINRSRLFFADLPEIHRRREAFNRDKMATHHDALEFPDGQIGLLTRLCEDQQATVLQLPAEPKTAVEVQSQRRVAYVG
jgi:hypothetical protein